MGKTNLPDHSVNSDPITIRRMRTEELPDVERVDAKAFPFPWSHQIFLDCLQADALIAVLKVGNEIVGYGVLSRIAAGETELLNLAIDPQQQGRGFGEQLLRWLMTEAQQAGAEMIFLEVRDSNQAAQKLYEKLGFNEIGLRKNYYRTQDEKREDARLFAAQFFNEFEMFDR